jgi:hypothetical protein
MVPLFGGAGRVVPVEQDISIMSAYPRELIYQHWNAWCGKLSSIVPGYSGRGGHNDECQMLGTMPIRDCQRALEASTACSALSHHSGKVSVSCAMPQFIVISQQIAFVLTLSITINVTSETTPNCSASYMTVRRRIT